MNAKIKILRKPLTPCLENHPFQGTRYGSETIRLDPTLLTALKNGHSLAIDVNDEYVIFLKLSDKK